jgi:branched-chain amino acid aminotransferase
VFVVKRGAIATPGEDAGILAGITRAHVIDAARARGIAVKLAPLRATSFARADEVFVTSSIREVMPIVAVDGRAVGSGNVGPITRALHADLRARAGVADLPMPWE